MSCVMPTLVDSIPQITESSPDNIMMPERSSSVVSSPPANGRRVLRRRGACEMCKAKKVRCDGGTPCVTCSRHGQECIYTAASRRRRHSKGSVDLDSSARNSGSEPPPPTEVGEPTPPPIEIGGDTTPRFGGNYLDPDFSAPKTPLAANMSKGALYHDPSWRGSCSDDQRAIKPVVDEFGEGSVHSMDLDAAEFHGYLSTTDVGELLDFSSVWIDGDRHIDFDTAFGTYHTTGLDAATPTELDIYELPKRPARSFEMSEICEENNGTPASLGTKGTILGYTDRVPSVNFSLKSISLWQDSGQRNFISSQQEAIYQILQRISCTKTPLSSVAPVKKNYHHSAHGSWYWNDPELIESCTDACFEQPLYISNFLTKPCFNKYMKEARARRHQNQVLTALIDCVMAFGYNACLKTRRLPTSPQEKQDSEYYYRLALNAHSSVLQSHDTLLKLQTILAMITICEHIDDAVYSELVAGAVTCARSLKLGSNESIQDNYASSEERDLARRALWVFYSIEIPYSLRRGISASLDHDWIDHTPPPQVHEETNWLLIQYLYAYIISTAVKMLYSQSALRQPPARREQELEKSHRLLEDWRDHLPAPFNQIHFPDAQAMFDDPNTRHIALCIFRQYHEAILIIYRPWTENQLSEKVSDKWRRRSAELCLNSAQIVLLAANQMASIDILLDSKFYDLISLSICVAFLDVATGRRAEKKTISYLGMGCGIFGRLNIENEVPLTDVLELTRIAQKIMEQ